MCVVIFSIIFVLPRRIERERERWSEMYQVYRSVCKVPVILVSLMTLGFSRYIFEKFKFEYHETAF
jgi:hypothetical protein